MKRKCSLILNTPYNFRTANRLAGYCKHKSVRVTYGTRTRKFYFIDRKDRDFDRFSMSLEKFSKVNKHIAKDFILRPSIWRN